MSAKRILELETADGPFVDVSRELVGLDDAPGVRLYVDWPGPVQPWHLTPDEARQIGRALLEAAGPPAVPLPEFIADWADYGERHGMHVAHVTTPDEAAAAIDALERLRPMSTDPATGAKVITPEDVRAQRHGRHRKTE